MGKLHKAENNLTFTAFRETSDESLACFISKVTVKAETCLKKPLFVETTSPDPAHRLREVAHGFRPRLLQGWGAGRAGELQLTVGSLLELDITLRNHTRISSEPPWRCRNFHFTDKEAESKRGHRTCINDS